MTKRISKFYRASAIFVLGLSVFIAVSVFLANTGNRALATIYWGGGQATDSFFIEKLFDANTELVHGTPIRMNAHDGFFAVVQRDQGVPSIIDELEQRFSDLPSEDVIIGRGKDTAFFTAKADHRIIGIMLVRDRNINKTMMFAATLSDAVLYDRSDPLGDKNGTDPVAELRPPGSQRVLSLASPSFEFAAYKSINANLTNFYESTFSNNNITAVSVNALKDNKFPNTGDLFYFDSGIKMGFVLYQSDPKNGCSYSVVCTQ